MNAQHIKVLLIEDNPIDIELFQESLNELGHGDIVLLTASCLKEGLQLFEKEAYDVVILDLSLPDSEGEETFRRVYEVIPEIPIMILSGLDDEELAVDLVRKGAQDYLVKGKIDSNLIFRMIRYAVERKRLEKDLKNTRSQLLQSDKLSTIGQLTAGIAHEINNPISFVGGNLQTLEGYVENQLKLFRIVEELKNFVINKEFDKAEATVTQMIDFENEVNLSFMIEDMDQLLQESLRGIERIKKIVMDLKSFAREGGEEMELVQIEDVMEGILGIIWNEIKSKAEIQKNYDKVPAVKCSQQKIGQVFMNLLLNAAQSIKETGTIGINIYQEGSDVCIEVTDSGEGIDTSDLESIFEPYFTTKPVGQGTGLGLSISHGIVKKHGGDIKVKSKIGEGTMFKVILPIKGKSDRRKTERDKVEGEASEN